MIHRFFVIPKFKSFSASDASWSNFPLTRSLSSLLSQFVESFRINQSLKYAKSFGDKVSHSSTSSKFLRSQAQQAPSTKLKNFNKKGSRLAPLVNRVKLLLFYTVKSVFTCEFCDTFKLFFDPDQFVVLGDAVGPAH